jgi:hypothetical protein
MSAQEMADHFGDRVMHPDRPRASIVAGYGAGYAITPGTQIDPALKETVARRAAQAAQAMEIAYARVFNPEPLDPYVWHDVARLIDA